MIVECNDAACEAKRRLKDAAGHPGRRLKRAFRNIQPYVVTCRTHERGRFEAAGLIAEILPGMWEWLGDYDEKVGIVVPDRQGVGGARFNAESLFL